MASTATSTPVESRAPGIRFDRNELSGAFGDMGTGFETVIRVFPLPILGILLLFEALMLIGLVRDVAPIRPEFLLAGLIGLCCAFVPYGFLVGLAGGTVAHLLMRRGWVRLTEHD